MRICTTGIHPIPRSAMTGMMPAPWNWRKNQYGNDIWPQSDNYMVEQTFDLYVDQQPFNIYYMTISGHMPYADNGNSMAVRNYDQVADLPYSEDTKVLYCREPGAGKGTDHVGE